MIRRYAVTGLVDQAIVSASNFLTAVVAAKLLGASDFGVFSVIWTTILISDLFSKALVTGPLRVYAVRAFRRRVDVYSLGGVCLQMVFAFFVSSTVAILFSLISGAEFLTIFLLASLSFLVQSQNFFRAWAQAKFKNIALLKIDLAAHILRFALFFALYHYSVATINAILSAIAIGFLLSILVAIFEDRTISCRKKTFPVLAKRHWDFGRWLLAEGLAHALATRVYIYWTAGFVGIKEAGVLAAAQTLVNVLNIGLLGTSNFGTSLARRELLRNGESAWRRLLIKLGVLLVTISLIFAIAITSYSKKLLDFFFIEEYAAYSGIVSILALSGVMAAFATIFSIAFRTAGQPQIGFMAKLISGAAALVLAYPLVSRYGVAGAAIGILISQTIWVLGYVIFVARGRLRPIGAK